MDSLVLPVPHLDRPPSTDERRRFLGVFFDVAPAMFIGTLDQTIVAAALPAISADLGGLANIAWLVTAYLLCATVAAPIYGRLGDAFGRRRVLLWALAVFLVGSAACAEARSLDLLVAARALQGLGGGGLMTLAQALIGEAVSPKERGRFQGWFGAVFALASTLGPIAGGFLSQHLGWRSIFWVNVPLGLGATAAAMQLRSEKGSSTFSPDLAGTLLFVGATVAILLALSLGSSLGWTSTAVGALAVAGLAGFAVLPAVERRSKDPLLPPQLLALPVVWRSGVCVLLFAAQLFALVVELPLLLQQGFGASASASGLLLLPLTLAQVATSTAVGSWISRTGRPRGVMVSGLAVAALGLALLVPALSLGVWGIGAAVVLIGVGLGTTMPAAQTMVQWAGGTDRLGSATASLSFARSIGGVLGAAVASAILVVALRALVPDVDSPGPHGHERVQASFRWVFGALAMLGAIATAVARTIPDIDLAAPPPYRDAPASMRRPASASARESTPRT
jgi:EmrB/QacA subfamily drug resistance transporter